MVFSTGGKDVIKIQNSIHVTQYFVHVVNILVQFKELWKFFEQIIVGKSWVQNKILFLLMFPKIKDFYCPGLFFHTIFAFWQNMSKISMMTHLPKLLSHGAGQNRRFGQNAHPYNNFIKLHIFGRIDRLLKSRGWGKCHFSTVSTSTTPPVSMKFCALWLKELNIANFFMYKLCRDRGMKLSKNIYGLFSKNIAAKKCALPNVSIHFTLKLRVNILYETLAGWL